MWIPSSLCRRKQWTVHTSVDIISYQVPGQNQVFPVKYVQHFHTLWEELYQQTSAKNKQSLYNLFCSLQFPYPTLGKTIIWPLIYMKFNFCILLHYSNILIILYTHYILYTHRIVFVHYFLIPSNLTSISLLFSNLWVTDCTLYFTASEMQNFHLLLLLEHNTRKAKGK